MVALRTESERQGADNRQQGTTSKQRAPLRSVERERLFSIFRPEGYTEEPLPFVRKDALPDHVAYRDDGCELAPSCLACPLPRCQYDEPKSVRKWLVEARDREIALIRRKHRAPINALARTYGLTRRSVFRILAEQWELEAGR